MIGLYDDIIINLAHYLNLRDLNKMMTLSKEIKNIIDRDVFWNDKLKNEFNINDNTDSKRNYFTECMFKKCVSGITNITNEHYRYIETPLGGDYITCPKCMEMIEINDECIFCDDNDDLEGYYCIQCNILFDTGCVVIQKGCTDDEYAMEYIKNFKINGKQYLGTPIFITPIKLRKFINYIKFEWKCLCKKCQDDGNS